MAAVRLNQLSWVTDAGIRPAAGSPQQTLHHDGLCFSLEGADELVARAARVASYGPRTPSTAPQPESPEDNAGQRSLAAIGCRLHQAPPSAKPLKSRNERGWLRWEWTGDEARVWTLSGEARISRRASELWVEAWLPAGDRAVQTLLGGISSAILHALGGLIVHSSSVRLDGGVIAFVGPSGAGKSTASRQAKGASLFSVDRLAIVPLRAASGSRNAGTQGRGGWLAYPLLGGTVLDPEMPRAPTAWSPLHAMFRVHQAPHECRVEASSPAGKLALLRESTYLGGHSANAELELLSRLEQLSTDVAVARLHFSLGTSLTALLRRSVPQSSPE